MYFENKKAARGVCSWAAWRCALPLEAVRSRSAALLFILFLVQRYEENPKKADTILLDLC